MLDVRLRAAMATSPLPLHAMDDTDLAAHVAQLRAQREKLAAEVSGYHDMLARPMAGDPPRGTVSRRLSETMSRWKALGFGLESAEYELGHRRPGPAPAALVVQRRPQRATDWDEPTETDPLAPWQRKG